MYLLFGKGMDLYNIPDEDYDAASVAKRLIPKVNKLKILAKEYLDGSDPDEYSCYNCSVLIKAILEL